MIRKPPEGDGNAICLKCFHLFYKDENVKKCPKCDTEHILFLVDVECSLCKKVVRKNLRFCFNKFPKFIEPVCLECAAKILYRQPVFSHLTMLDYFAGKAMQAFIENAGEVFLDQEFAQKIAIASYKIAQEMIWHRNDFDLE